MDFMTYVTITMWAEQGCQKCHDIRSASWQEANHKCLYMDTVMVQAQRIIQWHDNMSSNQVEALLIR